MLYKETFLDTFVPWKGESILGTKHPLNIEELWTPAELAAKRLYVPADADPVPAGKIITDTTVQRVGGVAKYVYTLIDGPTQVELDTASIDEKFSNGRTPDKALANYIRQQLNIIRAALPTPLPPITKAQMKADLLDQLTK